MISQQFQLVSLKSHTGSQQDLVGTHPNHGLPTKKPSQEDRHIFQVESSPIDENQCSSYKW